VPDPTEDDNTDFLTYFNKGSLRIITSSLMEASLTDTKPGEKYQFLRHGYFSTDADSQPEKPVFNQTVGLKDSFIKEIKKN
jgi:glutaminyl-tRNA synthetase